MAYEPTTWRSGDIVTSEKLNKMEQGIANGTVMLTKDEQGRLPITYSALKAAVLAGGTYRFSDITDDGDLYQANIYACDTLEESKDIETGDIQYNATFSNANIGGILFKANSPDSYLQISL